RPTATSLISWRSSPKRIAAAPTTRRRTTWPSFSLPTTSATARNSSIEWPSHRDRLAGAVRRAPRRSANRPRALTGPDGAREAGGAARQHLEAPHSGRPRGGPLPAASRPPRPRPRDPDVRESLRRRDDDRHFPDR